tara:strand:+ start:14619 stop:15266 length:648 start_codon:yes stop_codon:yes gene_type:complete
LLFYQYTYLFKMMFTTTYKQIKYSSTAIYKEKGSKFMSYIFPVYNQLEIKEKIKLVKSNEKGANHYCFAYILFADKSCKKSNDDGEPNSTAGLPILKAIETNDLTNTLIIVVRYFGGKKLGIPGLIRSYKTSALEAINKSEIIIKSIIEVYKIIFEHNVTHDIMKELKRNNAIIISHEYNLNHEIKFSIVLNKSKQLIKKLKIFKEVDIIYIKTK